MRIVLWILLLLGLAFAVSRYHTRFLSEARDERDARRRAFQTSGDLPDGFGHAIVGEASGAPLVETETPPVPPLPQPRKIVTTPPKPADKGGPSDVASHVVGSGESLSKICSAHYGTGRPDVVAAVAAYNKIDRVDAIREGQTIRLPPLSSLNVPP